MRGIAHLIFFILLLATLSGCVEESTPSEVKTVNVLPAVISVGDPLTCDYSISSGDDAKIVTTVEWLVNGDKTGTGDTFSAPVGGSLVACKVTISANDLSKSLTSTGITVTNSPPIISSVTISPTSAVGNGDRVSCFAFVNDVDGNDISLTYLWLNGDKEVAYSSEMAIEPNNFAAGDTITCIASVDDGFGGTASASDSKDLVNTMPAINSVSLSPDSPVSGDIVTCSWQFYDVDNDTDSSSNIWNINGIESSPNSLTYTAVSSGDEIICEVTPSDGALSGARVSSETVMVLNSQPSISEVIITPNSGVTSSSTLSCLATGQDIDGIVEISYVWRNGASVVGGGPNLTMNSNFYSSGDVITCVATAMDLDGATITSLGNITIGNSDPEISGVYIYPTSAKMGDVLNCNYSYFDNDNDFDSSYISWSINGVLSGNSSTLNAPTGGSQVSCSVSANDGQVDGNSMISTAITISNTIPVITGIYITPASANAGETLFCFYTLNDPDADPDQTSLLWYVDGLVAENGTSMTAPASGAEVICQATPDDGIVIGVPLNSSAIVVGNTAPVISSVTLTPQTAFAGDTLTCGYSFSDIDGQPDQSIINWQLNGQHFTVASSIAAPAGGSDVSCSVTAFDGESFGNTEYTPNITIFNTAPFMSSVSLSPDPAYYGDIITCLASGSDDDGEQLTYDYQWYVNATLDPTVTSNTHSSPVGGEMIECIVSVNDGQVSSVEMSSGNLTITNTNPTIDSISIDTSATIHTNSTVTCLATASDGDGHQITLLYEWYVRGGIVGLGQSLTLDSNISDPGDDLVCVATVEDEMGGISSDSDTEVIGNYAPVLNSITITPNTGVNNTTTITCSANASDADGDSIGFSYEWVNLNTGSTLGIGSTLTLQSSTTSSGDVIQCSVIASDSSGGSDVGSATVTVD